MCLVDFLGADVELESHPSEGLAEPDDGLELPDGDGYGVACLREQFVFLGLLAVGDVDALQLFAGAGREPRVDLAPGVPDILFEQVEGEINGVVGLVDAALVEVQDVRGHSHVVLGGVDVPHHEDAVESGEDGGLQLDLLGYLLQVVVPAEDGVGGGEHGAAGVQPGGDARLGHADGLLLHRLVDGHSVSRLHLVELVNAHDSAVRQHQGSSLDLELPCRAVLAYACRQAGCGRPLPRRVHTDRRSLLYEF